MARGVVIDVEFLARELFDSAPLISEEFECPMAISWAVWEECSWTDSGTEERFWAVLDACAETVRTRWARLGCDREPVEFELFWISEDPASDDGSPLEARAPLHLTVTRSWQERRPVLVIALPEERHLLGAALSVTSRTGPHQSTADHRGDPMTHATVIPVRPVDSTDPAATPQGWAHSREFGVDAASGRLHILRLIVRDGVSWLVVSNDAATEGDEWLAYADEAHVLATGEVARYAEDLPTLLETLQRAAA